MSSGGALIRSELDGPYAAMKTFSLGVAAFFPSLRRAWSDLARSVAFVCCTL